MIHICDSFARYACLNQSHNFSSCFSTSKCLHHPLFAFFVLVGCGAGRWSAPHGSQQPRRHHGPEARGNIKQTPGGRQRCHSRSKCFIECHTAARRDRWPEEDINVHAAQTYAVGGVRVGAALPGHPGTGVQGMAWRACLGAQGSGIPGSSSFTLKLLGSVTGYGLRHVAAVP